MRKLNDHPLYCFLSEAEIVRLKSVAHQQHFQPQETIIRMGNRSRDIISLEQGKVSISIKQEDDCSREVARIDAGNLIGEMNFIIPTRRTADVIALCEVEAIVFPYAKLCKLLKSEPELAHKVFAALNVQLRNKLLAMLQQAT